MTDIWTRIEAMYSHRGDGIPTQYVNRDGPEAAARGRELEAQLVTVCQREADTIRRYDAKLDKLEAECDALKAEVERLRKEMSGMMRIAGGDPFGQQSMGLRAKSKGPDNG